MHLLILLGALAALLLTAAPAAAASFSGDFNGDGNSDLAVGAPGEDLGGRVAAGQVHVFYGRSDAACFGRAPVFAGARSQAFTQDTTGVPGVARERDRFGAAFAAGDLDRDGFDDLAIGAPGDAGGAGTVLVLRGSPAGLVTSGARLVRQGAGGVPGAEEDGDEFGASLLMPVHTVSVPFLAIGAPGESIGAARNAGAVSVLYAPNASRAPHQLTQDTPGIPGRAETGDGFGGALGERGTTHAAGLSVGAPGEAIGTALGAGNVTVLTATAELGVSPAATPGPVELRQGAGGIPGRAEANDRFGAALHGFWDDLFVGAPGEGVGAAARAGALTRVPDPGFSPVKAPTTTTQATPGIPGAPERDDAFGTAIGSLIEGAGDVIWTGAPGDSALLAIPRQPPQGTTLTAEVVAQAGPDARLGETLTVGDFNCGTFDSESEIAVGVPGGAGRVDVLFHEGSGDPTPQRTETLSQGTPDVPGSPERGDAFGAGL